MSRTIATAAVLLFAIACDSGPPPPDTRPEVVKHLPPPLTCTDGTSMYGLGTDKLEQWCQTEAGKMSGPYKAWHLGGQKAAEGQFNLDNAHGKWIWWYDNGKQQSTRSFGEGKDKGTWTSFTREGKKQQQGDFLNGLATGTWTVFYDNGTTALEGNYVNGNKHGEWNWNDNTGERTKQELWEGDKLVATTEEEEE